MFLEKVNLQRELEKNRRKEVSEEEILEQVRSLFRSDEEENQEILKKLAGGVPSEENPFNLDLMESHRIFHISHIKNICITYRLRFLDTKYFKASLPHEALYEIKRLEKQHQISLKGFKIVAPSKNFRLENADDPMLFAPIGNDYFYLIHKWGDDLNPFRKLLMWPLKNMENLLFFTVLSSFLMTFIFRELFFAKHQAVSEFIMLFMFTFKAMVGLTVFYGVALGKNFSSGIWNSKYFNA